jgi:hypothetical protein
MLIGLAARTRFSSWSSKAKHDEHGGSGGRPGIGAAALSADSLTAFAFILGVVPLMLASGAGAAPRTSWARRSSGNVNCDLFRVFLIPATSRSSRAGEKEEAADPEPAAPSPGGAQKMATVFAAIVVLFFGLYARTGLSPAEILIRTIPRCADPVKADLSQICPGRVFKDLCSMI